MDAFEEQSYFDNRLNSTNNLFDNKQWILILVIVILAIIGAGLLIKSFINFIN